MKVSVDVPPAKIGLGAKSLEMVGAFRTVSEAVALPVDPVFVPPFVDEINPLTFWYDPAAVPVILTLTVQELFAGIVPIVVGEPKVRLVAPALGAQVGGGVPPQVVVADGVAAT